MSPEQVKRLKPGDRVYWNDPDGGQCSRVLTIAEIADRFDMFTIVDQDESVLECYPAELSTPPKVAYLVAVYDQGMVCGGREEGGWYYDAGSLVRMVKMFRSEHKAGDYCRRLNARLRSRDFGPNQGKREYSSVLSEGELRAHVYENECPKGFPERRPHYE